MKEELNLKDHPHLGNDNTNMSNCDSRSLKASILKTVLKNVDWEDLDGINFDLLRINI